MQDIGRNDPCPCGSGKKYKKCCLSDQQPTSDDLTWRHIQGAHTKLAQHLIKFTASTYGPIGMEEAWAEFNLWLNEEPFDPSTDLMQMFMPWMFYHWTPDPTETELSEDLSFDLTPAEAFIHKLGSRLGDLELEDLAENLRRPFSFYDVLESDPGQWVKVQDLLTEERFTVIEKMGSKSMKTGDLLFGKVITVRDVCMFDGLAPFLMPPKFKVNVVHERKRFRDKSGLISPVELREYDLELLKIFWDFYEELYNPAPPILTNTDGDFMVPHELTFSIESIEDTFERET